jgi:hypothetical protein
MSSMLIESFLPPCRFNCIRCLFIISVDRDMFSRVWNTIDQVFVRIASHFLYRWPVEPEPLLYNHRHLFHHTDRWYTYQYYSRATFQCILSSSAIPVCLWSGFYRIMNQSSRFPEPEAIRTVYIVLERWTFTEDRTFTTAISVSTTFF